MLDSFFSIFHEDEVGLEHEQAKEDYQNSKIQDTESRLRELEQRHEQLKLATLAMWSLLRDHSGLMESDLKKYVEKIDLLDGKRDGKVDHKKEKVHCKQCKRVYLSTSPVCPWCGKANVGSRSFG